MKGRVSPRKGMEGLAWENNPLWKGGGIDAIKRRCLIRDDFTCQDCGLRDVDIVEVDHIVSKKERPDLHLSVENMQALCPNCHRRKTNAMHEGGPRYHKHLWKQRYKTS
jgi:5-methylcytosine-specific restriction endonuclease McrA